MHMFRSIDRSLRPTGHMPRIILRLCGFLCVRDAGPRGTKSLYDHLIAVYSADICMLLVDLLVHISREVKFDFLPRVSFGYSGSCVFNEITCKSGILGGYLKDGQLTLINTKASSIS